MAMSGTVLGAKIANIVTSSDASAKDKARILKTWQDIASEIVTHIQENAQVSVNAGIMVTGSSATGGAVTGATTSIGQGKIL